MNAWQRCAGVWAPIFAISPGTSAQGSDSLECTICHADKAQAREGAAHAGRGYAGCYTLHHVLPPPDALSILDPANLPETYSKGQPGAGTRFAPRSAHELPGGGESPALRWFCASRLIGIPLLIRLVFPHDAGNWAGERGDLRLRWPRCRPWHDKASDAIVALAYSLSSRPTRAVHTSHSHAENAEYWAVVWGSVLISIVGLTLWTHYLFLASLPVVFPQSANAVHFYQVMLAVLAILVWHSYSVIFDSEVYPLDPVGLTGHSVRRCGAEQAEPEKGEEGSRATKSGEQWQERAGDLMKSEEDKGADG